MALLWEDLLLHLQHTLNYRTLRRKAKKVAEMKILKSIISTKFLELRIFIFKFICLFTMKINEYGYILLLIIYD